MGWGGAVGTKYTVDEKALRQVVEVSRDDVARAVELTSGRDIVARVQIRLTLLW